MQQLAQRLYMLGFGICDCNFRLVNVSVRSGTYTIASGAFLYDGKFGVETP